MTHGAEQGAPCQRPQRHGQEDERDEDGKAQQRERASQTVSDRSSPFLAIDIRGPTSLTFGGLLLTPRLEARLQCRTASATVAP